MSYVSKFKWSTGAVAAVILLSSCEKERSGATGYEYNNKENGGYERRVYIEQETGPGLVLVEGGTFTMGAVDDEINDISFAHDNVPRRVTVSSFYMDQTEVTNQYWLDYLHWLGLVYGDDYPQLINRALPDTNIWREATEYNEPYVDYYLRHPAYRDYPVVGVSWLQATDYCAWRTDRVNEVILIREGLLTYDAQAQTKEQHFTTDSYLIGQYEPNEMQGVGLKDYSIKSDDGVRNVTMSDGILLPRYRLPTEAEWEYAALGLIGNSFQELVTERRTYPWNGHFVRNNDETGTFFGTIRANFVRGGGDYMGVAGALNDNADVTAPVYAYPPNDYGLYNMSGNVSEWVMDVYRPLSPEDKSDFRPFRGNVFETKVINPDGTFADKYDYVTYDIEGIRDYISKYREQTNSIRNNDDSDLLDKCDIKLNEADTMLKDRKVQEANMMLSEFFTDEFDSSPAYIAPDIRDGISKYIIHEPGEVKTRDVTVEENLDRRNYRKSDYIDHKDGDLQSSIYYKDANMENDDNRMYEWGVTTLINDRARVYKGGNWRDRAYFTIPGTRRFLDERRSLATLGFRCAMDRLGSPTGIGGRED
ncbi:MAG: SUMF1/EgtB/PvdO family nonheme iron enzyme [Flavobacteriales bacterium]